MQGSDYCAQRIKIYNFKFGLGAAQLLYGSRRKQGGDVKANKTHLSSAGEALEL